MTKDTTELVAFQEEFVSRTQAKWIHDYGSADEKWIVIRSALTETAEVAEGWLLQGGVLSFLMGLMHTVWEEQELPKEW